MIEAVTTLLMYIWVVDGHQWAIWTLMIWAGIVYAIVSIHLIWTLVTPFTLERRKRYVELVASLPPRFVTFLLLIYSVAIDIVIGTHGYPAFATIAIILSVLNNVMIYQMPNRPIALNVKL